MFFVGKFTNVFLRESKSKYTIKHRKETSCLSTFMRRITAVTKAVKISIMP